MDGYVCITALVAAEPRLFRMSIDQSTKEDLFRRNGAKKNGMNRQPQWRIKTNLPAKYVDTSKILRKFMPGRIGYYGYK